MFRCELLCLLLQTDQGIKNLSVEDAARLSQEDPDYGLRDLFNAIATGNYPSWTFYIQVMKFSEAEAFPFNPFDVTKVSPLTTKLFSFLRIIVPNFTDSSQAFIMIEKSGTKRHHFGVL